MSAPIHRPARRWRDIFVAVVGIGLGTWLITYGQKEWRDEELYRVKTKFSEEVKTGREMNRNRMIFGLVALGYGGYLAWSLFRHARATNEKPNQPPEPTR